MIKVKPGLPYVEQNSAVKEKIKAAVAKRYEAKPEALDLSGLYTDPGERMVMCNTHTHTHTQNAQPHYRH
jgi:hypothetical protein